MLIVSSHATRGTQEFDMPQMSVLGVDVFYRDEGVGQTVVLGHSSTASSGQWRALFARLQNRYRLIAPDHLGYGRTAAYPGSSPLVDHELAIIDGLVQRVNEPVHLVGHSYGGALMARTAVRTPERVRSLTLIEPTLFYLLAAPQRMAAYQEIFDQAQRVIRYVDARDHEEAARGFIEYWVAPGAYDAMEERVRAPVTAGMAKLRDEWPTAFEAQGATLDTLATLRMPTQLIAGSKTTTAAQAVIHVLRSVWPAAEYAEITGAGHMSPVTHSETVNEVIELFLEKHTVRT
jgi:pimeloyl-ACP methyl ester carboxylesterase